MALVIRNTKKLSVLIGALTIVGLVAGPAWAPKVFRRQTIMGATCTAANSSGVFAGGIEVTHLTSNDGVISASGVLDGNCETPAGRTDVVQGQSVSIPLTVPVHDCTKGFVFDYTGNLPLPNMTITMSIDIPVEISDDAGKARRLCAAVRLFNEGRTEGPVRVLNTLLSADAREDSRQLEPR